MDSVVPAISPLVAGPLGVVHLPRMWLAGVCAALGRTAPGEPRLGGFDELVARGLGFDLGGFRASLATVPSYLECEGWVRAHARHADARAIADVNAAVALAYADGSPVALAADLRDWERLHVGLLGQR